MSNYKESRKWGEFENLLETEYYKVKRIIVKPHQKTSYQFHYKRDEVWTIVKGTATVIHEGEKLYFYVGGIVEIWALQKHQVRNETNEDLIFIEVQTGTYFGEDDIVRLKDFDE